GPETAGEPAVERPVEVLVLSAPSENGLRDVVRSWVQYLGDSTETFPDICHTAAVGRAHFARRLAVVARDAPGARSALEAWLRGDRVSGLYEGLASEVDTRGTAFHFPPDLDDPGAAIRRLVH